MSELQQDIQSRATVKSSRDNVAVNSRPVTHHRLLLFTGSLKEVLVEMDVSEVYWMSR